MMLVVSFCRRFAGWVLLALLVSSGIWINNLLSKTGLRLESSYSDIEIRVFSASDSAEKTDRAIRVIKLTAPSQCFRFLPGKYRLIVTLNGWKKVIPVDVLWRVMTRVSFEPLAVAQLDVRDWEGNPLLGYRVRLNKRPSEVVSGGVQDVRDKDIIEVVHPHYEPLTMEAKCSPGETFKRRVCPIPMPGSIKISVSPAINFELFVDGELSPKTDVLKLPPKRGYQVEVRAQGYERIKRTFEVLAPGDSVLWPITLTRSFRVPEAYETIQAAIDSADVGGEVRVSPGRYSESLKLRSGIRLIGDNHEEVVVVARSGLPSLTMSACATGSVAGITFEVPRQEGSRKKVCAVVVIENSDVDIRGCNVRGEAEAGIMVSGGSPVIQDCQIEGSVIGISLSKGTSALVSRNLCERNVGAGISVLGIATSPRIINNKSRLNGGEGIAFSEITAGSAEGNLCERNSSFGILVTGRRATPRISGNQCLANLRSGIYCSDESIVTADGNICQGNKAYGIFLTQKAIGTLNSNLCISNALSGITVLGTGTTARLFANRCEANGGPGIWVADGGNGGATSNLCLLNAGSGFQVSGESAELTAGSNICQGNKAYGIFLTPKAIGTLNSNLCISNALSGIMVLGTGTTARLFANRCEANGGPGIWVADGGNGGATSNLCLLNAGSGFQVSGYNTVATLAGNDCSENRKDGIEVSDGARGEVWSCRSTSNRINGIRVYLSANVSVSNNVFSVNKFCGISVEGKGSEARVMSNTCRLNGTVMKGRKQGAGVFFASGSRGTLTGNICVENVFCGIFVETKNPSEVTVGDNRSDSNGMIQKFIGGLSDIPLASAETGSASKGSENDSVPAHVNKRWWQSLPGIP